MKNIFTINIFSSVSQLDKIMFAKHLAVMAKSGISLGESIETLLVQTRSASFKEILEKVLYDIQNGQTLSKALSRFPKVFDPLYTNLIETGEQSGNLSGNLEYLAEQLERSYAFKNKVKSATMYPMIVISLAIVVGGGISIFVLPKLLDMFAALDVALPWNTRVLVFVATMFKNYGMLILAGAIGLVAALRILVHVKPVRFVWHTLLLKIPVMGQIIADTELALLCRNLGVMIKSGMPITVALDIQYSNSENMVYKNYIALIKEEVAHGKSMADQFSHSLYPGIPPIMEKMVGVGDRTGKLDEILLYLSNFFEDEVDVATKNISIVLEPVLLFVITAIVGFVAMAIIMPIYQLTGSIK